MKIFFDHQLFNLQKFGGASNYIVNLVENLAQNVNPIIISPFYKNHYLRNSKHTHKIFYYNKLSFLTNYFNLINKIYFKSLLNFNKPDIIHYTYFNEKIFYKSKAKKVITEYDLIKEKFYMQNFEDQIKYKHNLFKEIDHIICISENTRKDLHKYYDLEKSKVSLIHLAVKKNKTFRDLKLNLRPFILYVGSRKRYKNFINFIKAYSISKKLKSDFDIICFGGGRFSKSEFFFFKELSLEINKIHHYDGDELDLNYFYKKANLFVFPSLYEGFGLPILEAMNMGCPVACSNSSCFPEIAGDAALFFEPNEIDSIKKTIEKLIYDNQLLTSLNDNAKYNLEKFSWKKCAIETEKVYKKLI